MTAVHRSAGSCDPHELSWMHVGCGLLWPRLKQTMKGYDEPWDGTAPPSPTGQLPYDFIGGTLDAGRAGKGDDGLGSC